MKNINHNEASKITWSEVNELHQQFKAKKERFSNAAQYSGFTGTAGNGKHSTVFAVTWK